MDYYGSEIAIGDQIIMDEALKYLDQSGMDLSRFDSDNNGMIDSIVLITTLEIDGDENFYWAYRYWNLYTDADENYYEYDGVSANDYLWASYAFMHESDTGFDDSAALNTYTYIHEFGHILGADDYYDTAGQNEPMDGRDVMDAMLGDHSAYTKFNLGWITSSRLVTADSAVTITLESFGNSGDTVILATNWSDELGAYQEYYIVVYYTDDGLNEGDAGCFDGDGIVIYRINASLYREELDGETYYDVYFNNTDPSDEYGTDGNLIELVRTESDYTLEAGDSYSGLADSEGTPIAYTLTVNSLGATSASLTFAK